MKVALCLFGQPRYLDKGFPTIKEHIIDVYEPDVFYHTWESKEPYSVAPWRNDIETTPLEDIEKIKNLYLPKKHVVEASKIFPIDTSSPGYLMAPLSQQKNANNIVSQVYSRQMVRNLLRDYASEHKIVYDLVIMTRFDIFISNLPLHQDKKIYFADTHPERPHIFNDTLIMANHTNFLEMMDIYPNLNRYLTLGVRGKPVQFNMEELLTGSLIDHNLLSVSEKRNDLNISLL